MHTTRLRCIYNYNSCCNLWYGYSSKPSSYPKFTNWTPALIFTGQKSETIFKSLVYNHCWILFPLLLSHVKLRQLTLPFVIRTYKASQKWRDVQKVPVPSLRICATQNHTTTMENMSIFAKFSTYFSSNYPSFILFSLSIRLKHTNIDIVSSVVGVEVWPACRPPAICDTFLPHVAPCVIIRKLHLQVLKLVFSFASAIWILGACYGNRTSAKAIVCNCLQLFAISINCSSCVASCWVFDNLINSGGFLMIFAQTSDEGNDFAHTKMIKHVQWTLLCALQVWEAW